MKILTGSQQTAIPQPLLISRSEATPPGLREKPAAQRVRKGDTVQISIESELKTRQADQAKRVDLIRSQVQSGNYRINTVAVAEKLLSHLAMGRL